LQNMPASELTLPHLDLVEVPVETRAARMDLTLVLHDQPDGLSGFAEYNTDLFDRGAIVRWLDQFARLLAAVAADPTQRLSTIPLLSTSEQQQILVDWNATGERASRPSTIHAVFEHQVTRTPDAIAVRDGGATITYRELDRRANQIAHALQRRGVATGTAVGVSLERSIEMVVAVLAILKCGAAYVPVNQAYPRERVEFMLRDTAASVVLTPECLASLLDGSEAFEPPYVATGPDSAAYIMYTSGSTGKPKGVQVTNANLSAYGTLTGTGVSTTAAAIE